jgi:hypothetical protein
LYVAGGERTRIAQANGNPKNAAPLFLRSAFDQIHANSLTLAARTWLQTHRLVLRQELVRRLRPTLKRLRGGGFPYSVQYALPLMDRALLNVPQNVGPYVLGALQGHQDDYTRTEGKSLLAPEGVGAARPAPVMEFRRISGAGSTPDEWVDKMKAVTQEIHNLNA